MNKLSTESVKRLKMMQHLMTWHWLYFPHTAFNLEVWASEDKTGKWGSAACAIGSAMYHPAFNKLGLRACKTDLESARFPIYKSFIYWEAVERFFGIGYSSARYLFNALEYDTQERTTAWQVSRRIKKYIKDNK